MTFKFPLATATWDQKDIDAIQNVIATGKFPIGRHVNSFEKIFSQDGGYQNALLV